LSNKICKGCGVEKELLAFYVVPNNSDGRMGKCKLCVRARVRENRRNRSEKYAQYERSRANLPHRVEARQKYQQEHRELVAEYKKSWAEENAERVILARRNYYERNREEVISRSRKWAEDNPDKVKMAKTDNRRKRRAAKHAGRGNFTAQEFIELCDWYGNRCLSCGDTETLLEADHVVPLAKGGSDDIGNIQPLCGFCNRKRFVNIVDYRVSGVSSFKQDTSPV
jgi:5-methylcytosine-specific restriction endonuclease McrA